jgi:hypothetical protein
MEFGLVEESLLLQFVNNATDGRVVMTNTLGNIPK